MAAYAYRVQGLIKTPVQVVGEVLEELTNSEQGLTPATLVDASRDINAPLHKEFEWDDTVAAEKYRWTQAQTIIRNVVIISATDEEERETWTRAFVSTPGGQGNYATIKAAMNNEVWKEHLLQQAKDDMRAFVGKYRTLNKLATVVGEMSKLLDEL